MDGWPGLAVAATVLAALLSAAEWIDPEDRDAPRRRRRDRRAPAMWFGVYLTYAPAVAVGTTLAAAVFVTHAPARAVVARAPVGARVAGAILIADLGAYWLHRALHDVPALWRVHRVHHDATEVCWWSTFRFHPVDGALAHGVPVLAAAACGFGAKELSVYVALVFAVTVFAHADVWMPGGWAGRVVVLPAFHRSHHEIGRDDVNYGLVSTIWDTIFGTASFGHGSRRFGSTDLDQCVSAAPRARSRAKPGSRHS